MVTTKKYQGFVVPTTHWDRAWYLPFEQFRIKLVAMMDKLLEIFRTKPEYKVFAFDGQTVVIEDYLEICPEREGEIKDLVQSGRLVIGPWYVLADEFLVSGEALIRNLLIGHQIALKFGKVMKAGYVPDPFGHISQLPQILQGFGIDSAIFTRGTGEAIEKLGCPFKWVAPDGETWVYGLLQLGGYGNLAAWGVPKGQPVDTTQVDYELALTQVIDRIKRMEQTKLHTNYLLFGNGTDHLPAQPMIPELIKYVNQHQDLCELRQTSFHDYVEAVSQDNPDLRSYQGELHEGKRYPILSGVFSARMYLRQANQRAQSLLTDLAEPIATWNWLEKGKYPAGFLSYAWKTLLKNHPHDDICGCSVDAVHQDMMNRFSHTEQIAQPLIQEGWQGIVDKINTQGSFDGPAVVVYNPVNWLSSNEVSWEVDIPSNKFKDGACTMVDNQGKEMLSALEVKRRAKDKTVQIKGLFMAADVPACGYKTFYLSPHPPTSQPTKLKTFAKGMENEFYRVKFNPNGTIEIRDKETGLVFKNANLFEDMEDVGDEYDYSPLPGKSSKVITTQRVKAKIKLLEKLPYKISYQVDIKLPVPTEIATNRKKRSAKKVSIPITSVVTLYEGIKRIDFSTTIDNQARDHRMRAVFLAPIKTDCVWAESKFDVVRRPVDIPKVKDYRQMPVGTQHQDGFIDLNDGKVGLSLFNKGLPEYEVKRTPQGTLIYQTLFRSVGWLSRSDFITRRGGAGPGRPTPEAQCLGINTYHYSVMPHQGDWVTAKSYRASRIYNSTFVSQISAQKPGLLPPRLSFLKIEPDSIIVSAIKKAERTSSCIVRFYNIAEQEVKARISFYKKIKAANLVNMSEEKIRELEVKSDNSLNIPAPPKRIITIEISP